METRPVLLVDRFGRVIRVNETARKRFGVVVGRRCADVVDLRCRLADPFCGGTCAAELIARGDGQIEQHGTVRGHPSRVLCSAVGEEVVVVLTPNHLGQEPAERLTPREREVLGLVARGLTGRQIAKRLGLRPATVRTHVEHAREKLGCRSRAEAVARALALGILD